MATTSTEPWFAGEAGRFLLFRVNRRPLYQTLLTAQQPNDVYEHFVRMLAPGYEVRRGRRFRRIWRVGGLQRHDEERVLTGKLGSLPEGDDVVVQWSDELKDWTTSSTTRHGDRVVPFGFDGDTLLAVLSDRSSAAPTIASVFEAILRGNEAELPETERSTEWSVEPILNSEQFLEWLKTLDVVTSVSFTARLPNPEPRDAFRDLAERMEARRVSLYRETLRSDREQGLRDIEADRDVQQAIAMGEQGFATLQGRGLREGEKIQFSQTSEVAAERVERLPPTWHEVHALLIERLKGSFRRFLRDGDGSD